MEKLQGDISKALILGVQGVTHVSIPNAILTLKPFELKKAWTKTNSVETFILI